MKYTGERYVPELDSPEISYEHWHRYQFASPFVENKRVLDIACGEGYGSYFLSKNAKEVVGVDISPESIDYASGKYQRSNLSFLVGSVSRIPIAEDHCFDIIVSFETIEHVKDEEQQAFISEVKRLLSPKGIFIVSTPNKLLYSDIPKYKNEFHFKEFYYSEFEDFLSRDFRNVIIMGQKIEAGSYIQSLKKNQKTFNEFRIKFSETGFFPTEEERNPLYFLAVCSDGSIADLPSSFSIDLSQRIVSNRDERIAMLEQSLLALTAQFEEKDQAVQSLQSYITEKEQSVQALSAQVVENEQSVKALSAQVVEKEQSVQALSAQVVEKEQSVQALSAQVAEQEQLFARIYSTKAWHLVQVLWRIRLFLIPHGSLREQFVHSVVKILKIPFGITYIKDTQKQVVTGELIYSIETDLQKPVVVGNGLAFYLKGWCYHTLYPISRLEVIVEGKHFPVKDHSYVRFDVLNEQVVNQDQKGYSLLSGFEVVIPFEGIQSPKEVPIQLAARLENRDVVTVNAGVLQLEPSEPQINRVRAPLNSTGEPLVAICMATFNPNIKLFEAQIKSILQQDYQNWVCIISDDFSQPRSFESIKKIVALDERFYVYQNSIRLGVYKNFEQSLKYVPNEVDFIMFSDQDDEWDTDKISILKNTFDENTTLVYSDMRIVSTNKQELSNTFWVTRRNNYRSLETLLFANTVTGAASMFRSNLLSDILPFPQQIGDAYHDHWVACIALAKGKIKYIDRPLYSYVQHSNNAYGFQNVNSHHLFSEAGYMIKSLFTPSQFIRQAGAIIKSLDGHYYNYLPKLVLIAKTILVRNTQLGYHKKIILKRFANLSALTLFSEGLKSKLFNRPSLGYEWFALKSIIAHRINKVYYSRKKDIAFSKAKNNPAVAPVTIISGTKEVQNEQADLTGTTRLLEQMTAPIKVNVSTSNPERVNIVMATINFKYVFGGYISMFNLARKIASSGRRTRIVLVEPTDYNLEEWRKKIAAYPGIEDLFDLVETSYHFNRSQPLDVNPRDAFLATSCWTAHVASRTVQTLRSQKIVFFAQEYEPIFFPAGSFSALSHASYFLPQFTIFSTELLQEYFKLHGIGVYANGAGKGDRDSIPFQNAINSFPVHEENLQARKKKKLLFYARPEQHAARNMFELGLMGLSEALRAGYFNSQEWEFYGIGTIGNTRTVSLGGNVSLTLLPRVDLDEYYRILPTYDLGMSLMLSPHPSLVPLEMAAAGMVTVTNTFENKTADRLAAISSNLIAVDPTVAGISNGLAIAVNRINDYPSRIQGTQVHWAIDWEQAFHPRFMQKLGEFLSHTS
jgi:ubiquinone/menaquinone biosynthesis C-methylase UbiE/glycosyltransferase involved in cell wall biosynthesis